MDGTNLELKPVSEITGSFRVAGYQRGYRWRDLEVKCLLNDILGSEGQDYNLQPVVVKRDGENAWELVDGQQRLTTLYLIFQFMQRERLKNAGAPYSIKYDTRPKSKTYLQNPDAELANENVDFFHIYSAYECIRAWFDEHDTPRQVIADQLYRYLKKSVSVIWYQADRRLDPTELFTRLNIGKIRLTDAELFKALLLSRNRKYSGIADRRYEIAAQWDQIERDLQHPENWAFVADNAADESPTRITLLLDTIAQVPRAQARRQFQTFNALREMVDNNGVKKVWDKVVQLHALVLGWHENRDHYHKVGYLVAVGDCRFSDLVSLVSGKAKSEFDALLNSRISETLNLTRSKVEELSYESDKRKCSDLLLLMNVETVRKLKHTGERYSFDIHRSQEWSLEHIHAQHAENLTQAKQWKEWLRDHRDALVGLHPSSISKDERQKLLDRINEVINNPERRAFQELARKVTEALSSPDAVSTPEHEVSNLALLERGNNSTLSNAVFEVKRRRILELDKKGDYIPICTRQVFLKYFTDANAQQVHFWSKQDREAYLEAIRSGVHDYLKTEEPSS
ncbi:MAG: DUF262 domain-containing protein [Gammaproteobacteria bacterium]|nr:DUF262 domain-containing protein [Gammaproteobacteria bacterium]